MHMYRVALCLLTLFASVQPVGADDTGDRWHVLKGRIIRSLAIEAKDPSHILVGHKAKTPGSALVFQSRDEGKSWLTLNGNKSLHPLATDVQAVLAVSKTILLAGTWKQGLYLSKDSGKSFQRITRFPSADIRDLQTDGTKIYAATARDGVFESRDNGFTWAAIGPGPDFLWSMTLADNALFTSSPEKAVYERSTGTEWRKIFDLDGANAVAVTPGSGNLRAIAGAKGLYISAHRSWRKALKDENFADIIITRNNRIIAGSWDNGIAVLTSGGHLTKRLLAGKSVVHVQSTKRLLFAGTWGDGLHIVPMADVLSRPEIDPPLINAVLTDDLAEARRLLKRQTQVDAQDKSGNTALIFAARDGQTNIARLLLDAGANPGWVDGEGVTPLILAAFKNHPDIVKLLLDQNRDARITHADKWGRTALDYAKRRGSNDLVYRMLTQQTNPSDGSN